MFNFIFRILVSIFATVLILVGIILTPSPAPFGIIFVAVGLLLLTASAPAFVRWMRQRWSWLDRRFENLESILPEWIARQIRKSDPDEPSQNDPSKEESQKIDAAYRLYRDEKAGGDARRLPFV